MSREEHRKHDAALQALREQEKAILEREGISAGDIALWFLAAFMALGLFLAAPKLGREVTLIALIAMLGCLIHPISQLRMVKRAKSKRIRILWFLGSMTLAATIVTAFGIFVWPSIKRHLLTAEDRASFENALKSQKGDNIEVQLACSPNDDSLYPRFGDRISLMSPEMLRKDLYASVPFCTVLVQRKFL